MAKSFKNFIFLLFTSYLLLPASAGAAGLVPCGGSGEPDCTLCHFAMMADRIIDFSLWNLALPIALLFLVIGGIMFIVLAENEQKRSQAKDIITGVFIGLLIIFASWLIIEMIMNVLTNPGVFPWPWNEIDCTP